MFTKTDIEKYFIAEKQESLLFIIIGCIAILVALAGLLYWKTQFWKGASIPLIIIAVIQILVGYVVYARSDKQRTDIVYAYDMDPSKIKQQEMPRMETVNKNFVIYRWIEVILLIAGLAMIFLYKNNVAKQFFLGLAITLTIQAAIMLAADFVAEKRAINYVKGLESFLKKAA